MLKSFILSLIVLTPNHELNKDQDLLAEVAGDFEQAGALYDVPPSLMVYYYFREASLRIDQIGKLGEVGLPQAHGVSRRRCEDEGYDPKTWDGGIYCGAFLMDDSRQFCGSLESGLRRYASGSCKGSPKTQMKIKQRLRAWKRKWEAIK